jgi:hypothetical protein
MTPTPRFTLVPSRLSISWLKPSENLHRQAETSPFPNLALANHYETSRPGLLSMQTPKLVYVKDRSSIHTGTGHPLVSEKLA